MSGESWLEERDRIDKLLAAIVGGTVTHVDDGGLDQLQALDAANTELLTSRLAELDRRLGTTMTCLPDKNVASCTTAAVARRQKE